MHELLEAIRTNKNSDSGGMVQGRRHMLERGGGGESEYERAEKLDSAIRAALRVSATQ